MKSITVPISKEAMKRLDFNECLDGDLVEIKLNESEFDKMWSSGVFEIINDAFEKNIDIYEDEYLVGIDNLVQAKKLIDKEFHGADQPVQELLLMLDKAIENNTGIFFFF